MLQWVWFFFFFFLGGGFSWRGKVDSRNGLPCKHKVGAVQRQRLRRGQEVVYMTLCNSLCQLLVFAACHFLSIQILEYKDESRQPWWRWEGLTSVRKKIKIKKSTYVVLFHYLFTNLTLIFFGFAYPMQANEDIAKNISYVYIIIPRAQKLATRLAAAACWLWRRELSQHKLKSLSRECYSERTLDVIIVL